MIKLRRVWSCWTAAARGGGADTNKFACTRSELARGYVLSSTKSSFALYTIGAILALAVRRRDEPPDDAPPPPHEPDRLLLPLPPRPLLSARACRRARSLCAKSSANDAEESHALKPTNTQIVISSESTKSGVVSIAFSCLDISNVRYKRVPTAKSDPSA